MSDRVDDNTEAAGEAYNRQRMELIDVLAAGDGQEWFDFWRNPEQRRIGEVMYGHQANVLLDSSWLADRDARIRAEAARDV